MTSAASPEELKTLAATAAGHLADADAEQVLRWAVKQFGDSLIVASNMQNAVLIDVVSTVKPDVDVLFLDTGYHFAETLGTRDAVAARYPDLRIVNAYPEQTVAEQDAAYGPALHSRTPDQCCYLRKVLPLRAALANYSCWVTGVRRVDAPTRADTPVVMWDERNGLVKVNPLAPWTDEEFDDYLTEHNILQNPLVEQGYLSIGCAPCTTPVSPGADPRSGRWAGHGKTECGLHA